MAAAATAHDDWDFRGCKGAGAYCIQQCEHQTGFAVTCLDSTGSNLHIQGFAFAGVGVYYSDMGVGLLWTGLLHQIRWAQCKVHQMHQRALHPLNIR